MNPIKRVLISLSLLFILIPLDSQELEEHVIKDLQVTGGNQLGHIQSGGINLEVQVSLNHESATSGFFIPCLGSMGSEYGSLRLQAEGYIDVINHSGSRIYSIEYVGCSTSQADASNCLSGVSIDGSTYPAYYKEKNKPATNITSGLSFSGDTEEACRGYRLVLPETVYSGLGGAAVELTGFQSQVKTVRLIWTSGVFGGKSNSSMGEVPEFYGIKITTVSDSSVGLEEDKTTSNTCPILITKDMNGSYRLSEWCDIKIYDLSGRLILTKNRTDEFHLNTQSEGVYIITGRTNNTNQNFQQKLLVQ